ncbi:ComF family protein [Prauserella sp. PE36]|uniref:ComF family protein n=1 Tax=Prauserella sp. PE36 TaxID=1504709 RepID=UPI001F38A429|nr:ComF family protein [Prauserella sp. PE36]
MLAGVLTRRLSSMGLATLDLLLPSTCAGCGRRGSPCCPECAAAFGAPRPRGEGVYALAAYDGVARRLVLGYKERGRRDLAEPLGRLLAGAVPYLPGARPDQHGTWWLVPVPSRRSAARARGGPHVLGLARCCAAVLARGGRPAAVAPALELAPGVRDAVGLDRAQRAANLEGRLLLRSAGAPPAGAPIVLLDDVVTTGATLAAARRTLTLAGFEVAAALTLTAV